MPLPSNPAPESRQSAHTAQTDRPGPAAGPAAARAQAPAELGGPSGPEPTRYGDWERAGRCIDF